ncbi:MAG TPA: alkaline phosphatase family protein [Candidatus Eisenbacteria bacterium]|nr:alkaline phosphatase family protein [Candidatus Eisenbacteria bacterium]
MSSANGVSRQRVFVVGLDAATWDLVMPWVEAGVLPTLRRLIDAGVHAPLRSTLPALTPPGWTSAATGRNPGKHNIFNFYRGRAGGLSPAPVTPGDLRSPRVWDIVAQHGRRSVVLRMPLTYPPQESVGVMVSGIMTPKGTEDFVAPAALKARLEAQIPRYRMEVDAENLRQGDLDTFRADAFDLQRVQTEEALYLLAHEDWDLFWVMSHTLDKLQHFFWRYMDRAHPAYPGPGPYEHTIRDFHVAFDRALGRYLDALPPGTNVVLLSDHGSAPLHTYFCVMNWLASEGFLAMQGEGAARRGLAAVGVDAKDLTRRLKRMGLSWVTKLVPRALKGAVPQSLSSFSKIASRIDWNRTRAYCPSAPGSGLWVNLKGREPEGIVSPGAEYERVIAELRERLLAYRHPKTGEPIVTAVHRREEIYSGPHADGGPDLLVETARTVCMVEGLGRTALMPAGKGPEERTGNHARDGILLAYGPDVRRGETLPLAAIEDVAPTVLYLLGLPIDADMDGRVLTEALAPERVGAQPIAVNAEPYALPENGAFRYSADDEQRIQDMLEGLGYV